MSVTPPTISKTIRWLLGGHEPWSLIDVVANPVQSTHEGSLQFRAHPCGPFALNEPGGSLGGLVLPRGMALDGDGVLHLLDLAPRWLRMKRWPDDAPRVRRYNPLARLFVPLEAVGGSGTGARQFHLPSNLAFAGGLLYVADWGNAATKVFHQSTLALVQILDDRCEPFVSSPRPDLPWRPVDVATEGEVAYILLCLGDSLRSEAGWACRVMRHRAGQSEWEIVVAGRFQHDPWCRLVVDREHRIYLMREGSEIRLDVYERPEVIEVKSRERGKAIYQTCESERRYRCVGQERERHLLAGRFPSPPVVLDHRDLFCLPVGGWDVCATEQDRPTVEVPLAACHLRDRENLIFDRSGRPRRAEPEEWPVPLYQSPREFRFTVLDSHLYRCQWHRIDVKVESLPPGTWFDVATASRDEEEVPISIIPEEEWDLAGKVNGEELGADDVRTKDPRIESFLVNSPKARYLHVRLRLGDREGVDEASPGGAYASPSICGMNILFPRRSYLEHLPSIFSADESSRRFLERFLYIFQMDWDLLEDKIDHMADHFDARTTPSEFLSYLAEWLGVKVEGKWDDDQKRRYLHAVPGIIKRLGTCDAVRRSIRAALDNMIETDGMDLPHAAFPIVIEGYKRRNQAMLNEACLGEPGSAPLWGRDRVGRLEFGVFDRVGEARLVGTGDSERDIFHEHAHRFEVVLPAAWVRSENDKSMIRRAIRSVAPAHTCHDLCLVEPRLRIGLQSTVGIDTIVACHPVARLADDPDTAVSNGPPSEPLGDDLVLAGEGGRVKGIRLDTAVLGGEALL